MTTSAVDLPDDLVRLKSMSEILKSDHGAVVGNFQNQYVWKLYERSGSGARWPLLKKRLVKNYTLIMKSGLSESGYAAGYRAIKESDGFVLLIQDYISDSNLSGFVSLIERLPLEERQALFARLGAFVAGFHAQGYSHGDAKWGNIQVIGELESFTMIDLDAVTPLKERARYKDVARFLADMDRHGFGNAMLEVFVAAYGLESGVAGVQVMKKAWHQYTKIRFRHLKSDLLRS